MALLDAPAYDEAREKRRRNTIIIVVIVVLVIAASGVGWWWAAPRQQLATALPVTEANLLRILEPVVNPDNRSEQVRVEVPSRSNLKIRSKTGYAG